MRVLEIFDLFFLLFSWVLECLVCVLECLNVALSVWMCS